MILTLTTILAALPGPWRIVEFKSGKFPAQRERAQLALDDHLTLALIVSTADVQQMRLELLGSNATPQHFEVYLFNAQNHDAAPGVLGLATTAEEAVAVAADKVTRAILCGRDPKRLPPWLGPNVAERLRKAAARAEAAADALD